MTSWENSGFFVAELKVVKVMVSLQWELFYSVLETIHVIIYLNNCYCSLLLTSDRKKFPLRYVRYVRITLITSSETCKEVNSTSFNLKQEVFIRRDED